MLRRITLIAAQNEEDGARFVALGAKITRTVTGSLKFDISVTPQLAAKAVTLRRQGHHTARYALPPALTSQRQVVISRISNRYSQCPGSLSLSGSLVIRNASRMRLTLSARLD
ncbi:glycosyltransferase N-terminal domain-containing protein [Escherichia coli]